MSQFFSSGGQSTGASASVLPINIQDWFPLGWTDWISLQYKGFSRVFSNTTVQKHKFFDAQLSLWSNSHIHTWLLEKHSFYYRTSVSKVISLLFKMLSRLVIAFLPRNKCLLIHGCSYHLQWFWKWKKVKSLSRVRLFATPWTVAYQAPPSMGFSRQEYWSGQGFCSPPKIKSVTVSIVSPSICHKVMGPDAMVLMLSFKPVFSLSSFTFIKRFFSSSSMYRKMQESGLTEIIPMHLIYLVSGSRVFTSWISSGLILVSGCSLMAAREKLFFLSWVPSRLTSSPPVVAAITDDSDILCLLIRQETFHSSHS